MVLTMLRPAIRPVAAHSSSHWERRKGRARLERKPLNKLGTPGRASAPIRPRRRAGLLRAPEVVHAKDATELYLRGLARSEPLTREAEAELGRRITSAEHEALSALVVSPAGLLALAALSEELQSGGTNPRELLLNAEAPDAIESAARLASALDRARNAAMGLDPEHASRAAQGTIGADTANDLAALRVDPALVLRLDEVIAQRASLFSPDDQAAIESARARSAEARARAAREKGELVRANLRLVVATARRYKNRGVPMIDLYQEGNLGLLRAADKFDHLRGYRFGTYASWWIRQSIERALLYQGKDVRMPVHLTGSRRRVLGAERSLSQENARTPSQEEIAERSGVSLDKVQAVRALSLSPVSLDAPLGAEGETRFGDTLPSDVDAPDEALAERRMREVTTALLDELTPREREILRLRYGLAGGEDLTLEEIGRSFSLSRERIRQIESKALAKLRAWSEERGLGSYLDR
jgi:RNA polymerase primary sigma factor